MFKLDLLGVNEPLGLATYFTISITRFKLIVTGS